jgi:HAD superfamily hydrolase (TIGR01509 family)
MIIFDCDGVLIDSESVYIATELAHLADVGVHYDRALYVRRFMGLTPERWRAELAADVRASTGAPLPDEFFAGLDAALHRALRDGLRALPGVREVVTGLGRTRCVASSTPAPQLAWKLRHTGLDDLFGSHLYSADLVDRGKPAPDLFLHAAASMDVDPAACVVVEDSPNGVLAGVAAGMRVVGFAGAGHCLDGHGDMLAAAGAAAVAERMGDLGAAVDRLLDGRGSAAGEGAAGTDDGDAGTDDGDAGAV